MTIVNLQKNLYLGVAFIYFRCYHSFVKYIFSYILYRLCNVQHTLGGMAYGRK